MGKKQFPRIIFAAFILVIIVAFSTTGFAQKGKGKKGKGRKKGPRIQVEVPADAKPLYGKDFIKKFDFDKDGKVNHDEWEGIKPMTYYANDRWPQFDLNRDGFITLDEAPQQK